MNVRYRIELDQSEREQLTALLSGGKHAARKLKRAQILLAADSGVSDEVIATSLAIIQRSPKCASCSITCRHIHAAHSTKPSRRPKLTASLRNRIPLHPQTPQLA
jgi:hypothetical protein